MGSVTFLGLLKINFMQKIREKSQAYPEQTTLQTDGRTKLKS